MGFFRKAKAAIESVAATKAVYDYLSQFEYLPDLGKANLDIVDDWILYRNKAGETTWYVKPNDGKPLYVEERSQPSSQGLLAILCSYYTDKKGDSDERYVIALGTNDRLDAWFKVGDFYFCDYLAVGEDGKALFLEGDETLHVITLEGKHNARQMGDYRDCAGNSHGFFWWDEDGEENAQIKGVAFGLEKPINKKVKAPNEDMYHDGTWLGDDGVHVRFRHYEDDSKAKEFICDFEGNVKDA